LVTGLERSAAWADAIVAPQYAAAASSGIILISVPEIQRFKDEPLIRPCRDEYRLRYYSSTLLCADRRQLQNFNEK